MDKFNRQYVLTVETVTGGQITIQRPFTIEFEIYRNNFSSANEANFRVYNLNQNTRGQVRKDQYDFGTRRLITFTAGYGNPPAGSLAKANLGLGFAGYVTQAWSVREGSNFITTLSCFDGGFAYQNSVTERTFISGTPQSAIINSIFEDLDGVTPGVIGESFGGTISRGNTYSGPTTDILTQISGGQFFIDANTANCLSDLEHLLTNVPLINSQSGLLGTPVRENQFINFVMLFEPGLQVGQLIDLQSETNDAVNGTHKILSIRHRGTISDAVCGEAITEVGLLPGVFDYIPVDA
jgi:hypothetical protein